MPFLRQKKEDRMNYYYLSKAIEEKNFNDKLFRVFVLNSLSENRQTKECRRTKMLIRNNDAKQAARTEQSSA